MTLHELKQLTDAPASLSLVLQSLWHDHQDNWEAAHNCAQEDHSALGSWMHAYLHRKEGDIGNARYWYSQAGRSPFQGSLDQEWEALAQAATSGTT